MITFYSLSVRLVVDIRTAVAVGRSVSSIQRVSVLVHVKVSERLQARVVRTAGKKGLNRSATAPVCTCSTRVTMPLVFSDREAHDTHDNRGRNNYLNFTFSLETSKCSTAQLLKVSLSRREHF